MPWACFFFCHIQAHWSLQSSEISGNFITKLYLARTNARQSFSLHHIDILYFNHSSCCVFGLECSPVGAIDGILWASSLLWRHFLWELCNRNLKLKICTQFKKHFIVVIHFICPLFPQATLGFTVATYLSFKIH